MLLPEELARYVAPSVDDVLASYSLFANEAAKQPAKLLWNMGPKHNVMFHWAQQAHLSNPLNVTCFLNE